MHELLKCYHYCTSKFLEDLQEKRIIMAGKTNFTQKLWGAEFAQDYAFNKIKINNGNGMFFAWQHSDYKWKLDDILTDIDIGYKLLELEIPRGDEVKIIKTHYENWCSFGWIYLWIMKMGFIIQYMK